MILHYINNMIQLKIILNNKEKARIVQTNNNMMKTKMINMRIVSLKKMRPNMMCQDKITKTDK